MPLRTARTWPATCSRGTRRRMRRVTRTIASSRQRSTCRRSSATRWSRWSQRSKELARARTRVAGCSRSRTLAPHPRPPRPRPPRRLWAACRQSARSPRCSPRRNFGRSRSSRSRSRSSWSSRSRSQSSRSSRSGSRSSRSRSRSSQSRSQSSRSRSQSSRSRSQSSRSRSQSRSSGWRTTRRPRARAGLVQENASPTRLTCSLRAR